MKLRVFLLCMFFVTGNLSFARPVDQIIQIRNNTSQTLIVTAVYLNNPLEVLTETFPQVWIKNLNGIRVYMRNSFNAGEIRIRPNWAEINIAAYDAVINEGWERLAQMSFMEKMRGIFKSLRIAAEDGSKVITLDNLEDQIIEVPTGPGIRGGYYTIIIND